MSGVTSLVLAWATVRQRASWRAASAALAILIAAVVPFATYVGFADRFAYLSAADMAALLTAPDYDPAGERFGAIVESLDDVGIAVARHGCSEVQSLPGRLYDRL